MTDSESSSGSILSSLRYYDAIRLAATGDVTRPEDSNLDVFWTPELDETALCHLSGLFRFTSSGNGIPWQPAFEDAAAVALAAHHLNVGDGTIVPAVDGLSDRCNVRFTTEFADTELQGSTAMNHAVDQIDREAGSILRRPCAFVGAYSSAVSVPLSIVTSLFGYPQVSGASTSADLDNVGDHPLFARTIPSDSDNAIPIIRYFRETLKVTHLAVIFVNDSYGNAYLRGLNDAAKVYAPDMTIQPIILGEGEGFVEDAIEAFKSSDYRYVFCLAFSVHDDLMIEAYNREVAGNGKHNWFFSDSFSGDLTDRTFEKDSPLHLAYQGVGLFEVVGGIEGMPIYDNYTAAVAELRNSDDLQYLGSLFPTSDAANPPFINDEDFLASPLKSSYGPFFYEATIALGLAACKAVSDTSTLTGKAHYEALVSKSFTSASGNVMFDPMGTRDASGATYRVVNFLPEVQDGCDYVRFMPFNTDLYQSATWEQLRDFIFNDGTSNLPPDLPAKPIEDSDDSADKTSLIVALVVVALLVLTVFFFIVSLKRRKNQVDTTWYIEKKDLLFERPPKVIGKGEFGHVLQAEYRGMDVAIKRIVAPKRGNRRPKKRPDPNSWHDSFNGSGVSLDESVDSANDGEYTRIGMKPVSDNGRYARRISMTGAKPDDIPCSRSTIDSDKRSLVSNLTSRNKRIQRFMEEMQHLTKLRHSCIATVMGAIIETGIEPMLVMEYMNHGSLSDLLHNETMFLEANTFLNILWDIAQGMRFLHSSAPQVIHGDLKAANILMDRGFRAKVADFGLKDPGCTGTPYWMAPEILRSESENTTATDVYAFGIILYEVYSRRDPYEGEDPAKVLNQVASKTVQKRPPIPENMPSHIQSLMADCVQDDAEQRPIFEEIELRFKRLNAKNIRVEPERSKSFYGGTSSISLSDIFPAHIAKALREGRPVEPEHRDEVTIFFSDIVGFTDISAELPARKVAQMLNRLYTKFDALSRKYDIFKVETIGDAYMAVTNLVKDQPDDHAKRIAEFAVDAISAANETYIDVDFPDKGFVNIRVGFHSGPVVADVVGTRNLRYTLFGDTVNTASRMESNSKVNRIHCSSAAADLLVTQCPELPLRPRGITVIKGKGGMHTYWVNERTNSIPTKEQIEQKAKLEREESIIDWASSHGTRAPKRISEGTFQSSGSRMSFRFSALSNSSRSLRNVWRKSVTGQDLIEQLQNLDKLEEQIDEEIGDEISLSSGDQIGDVDEFALPTPKLSYNKTL